MATNTAPVSPAVRRDERQLVNTLKKTVNYGDAGISSGIAFDQSLPIGAYVLSVDVEVVTAFNAATTNVLTVGTNSTSYNNLASAVDVTAGTANLYGATRGKGRSIAAAADKSVFVKYTQTGTAATAGQAVIVITYEGGWST